MYNHWYHAVNVYLILPVSFKTELTSFYYLKVMKNMPKIDESRKRKLEDSGGTTKKAKIESEVGH